jgi:hypothetical protein
MFDLGGGAAFQSLDCVLLSFGGFMERPLFVVAVLTMIGAAAVFAQSAPSPSTSEGLELLNHAAQRYADAKSYYIESVEERTSSTE